MANLNAQRVPWALGALAAAIVVAGCGSSTSPAAVSRAAAPVTATTARPPAPTPQLRILSPRAGAHTGQTVTVRAVVIGANTRSDPLRYVLDGGLAMRGSGRIIFHGLAPGRHRLAVTLADDRSVRATTTFLAHAPPPAPSPGPAFVAQSPMPSSTPTPAPTPPAPPTTTSTPPPPPPPPSSGGGIPQGNAGDMDSDNNGGPSDGDGNV